MWNKAFLLGHRFGFIANLCFALCVILQWKGDFIQQPDLTAFLIVLGWLVAPIWSGVLEVWTLARWLRKTPLNLSSWLLFSNLGFFIFQLCYLVLFTK